MANITQLEKQEGSWLRKLCWFETDKAVDLPEEISNFGIWKQKPMVSVR